MADSGAFERVIAVLSGTSIKTQYNDDKVDRLNHLWTVFLLIIFALLTLTPQLVGSPIKCWTPAQFSDPWNDYTNHVCWIKNTYLVPMHETIPVSHTERTEREITYYQWTPIIFLLLAFMFKLPNLLWNTLNDYVGVDIDKIVKLAVDTQWEPHEKRKEKVDNLGEFIHLWVSTYRPYKTGRIYRMKANISKYCFCFYPKRSGNYLTTLYMCIKVLYCANVVGVFFLLNRLMSFEFNLYGVEVIDFLTKEGELKELDIFPRVTLCDFEIRQLNNIQRYSVQCVLPVNLFNEKLFTVLWFWLCLVAATTFINLFVWFYRLLSYMSGPGYIKKHLKIARLLQTKQDKDLCNKFVTNYLRPDGIFVMRIVEKNTSDLIVNDVIVKLYKKFLDDLDHKSERKPNLETSPDPGNMLD